MSLNQELKSQILEYIKQPIPQNAKMPIVKRSVPVPFFGNIEGADAATISINPSNEEHILPCYMLRNFLLFRAAVTDCIMGKFPNDFDFWIYTCRYLLMDDKEFAHCGYSPNGQNFPYKNE